ncbi:zinc finger, C2H2 type [Oesophagostomum dentatum]|uniref:Zinc finger, C2H2 type n=1 Tax=Oesophagostomum dentatum TaxID=61180 RepID=A0A0B1TPB7_OESDE|nr:zinc finger, C2H2 type [Oesophagostomum dentatum]
MGKTRTLQTPTSSAEIQTTPKTQTRSTRGVSKRGAPSQELQPSESASPSSTSSPQIFKYTNADCLRIYSMLSTMDQFEATFQGNLKEKLVRGAMKANGGSLPCFICQKFLSTPLGLVLHLRKCRGTPPSQERELPLKLRRTSSTKEQSAELPVKSLEELKAEPAIWLRISESAKLNILKQFFPDEKIECFAIPRLGKKCPAFTNYEDAISHLNDCVQPMYLTFIGDRSTEFRKLDKKLRSRYVREAMNLKLQLPCLECGRMFGHQYGLMYHVDRCNVADEEIPWKCYRCGFQATRAESFEHLRNCWHEGGGKLDEECVGNVMGALGDVNLRSGKSIPKDGADETIVINGESRPLSELSAKDALKAVIGPEVSLMTPKRRCKRANRASITSGVIPPSSNRMSLTGDGKVRFKFRKADVKGCVAGIAEYPTYVESVKQAHEQWVRDTAALPYCARLLEIKSSKWKSTHLSSRLPFISKESVGFRIQENVDKNSYQEVPPSCQRLGMFSSVEIERDTHDYASVAYCGGPINAISIAPNTLPSGEEVVVIVTYPCDTSLVGKDMKTTQGLVQFWLHSSEGSRSKIRPWFIMRSNFGVVFDAHWLDRPSSSEDDTLIGFLALSTAQGVLLLYRIDTTTVSSTASDPKKLPVFEPDPGLILRQSGPLAANDTAQTEDSAPHFPPPLLSIAWCTRDEAQHIVAVNAAGAAVIWDLHRSTDAPYVLLDASWCSPVARAAFINGFEVALSFRERIIRVYDVRTYECTLEEGRVRTAGSRVTGQPRLFSGFFTYQSEYFASGDVPCNGVSFVCPETKADAFFVVPLANRHEFMTWDVSASPMNAVVATCGADGKLLLSANGRLVTPSHTSDYGFSLLKTALCIVRRRIAIPEKESIQELVSKMEAPSEGGASTANGGDPPKKRACPSYSTHELAVQNLWLDIHLNPDSKGIRSQTQFSSLDLRIESLNCVATNHHLRYV